MAERTTPAIGSESTGRLAANAMAIQWASRNARTLAPLLTLIVMFTFFSLVTENFLSVRNLQNVVTQIGAISVAACGITFVLLCAEIDLSIAAVATYSGMVTAFLLAGGEISLGFASFGVDLPLGFILIISVVVAACMGLINGAMVAYVGIPSFMMTLAMLTIASGLAVWVSQGKPIFAVPDFVKALGSVGSQVAGIPVIGIFALGVLIICEVVLSYTKFGRYIYMTGANREAAEMSGVNTRRILLASLTICAFTAGMAGILYVGRLGSANPAAGGNLLIDAIAAVVLGGTSLFGGEGGIKNTILGLLIFGVLSNGLNLIPGLDFNFKLALQGIVLVAALLLNVAALRIERVQAQTE